MVKHKILVYNLSDNFVISKIIQKCQFQRLYKSNFMESLILAQSERWRRA